MFGPRRGQRTPAVSQPLALGPPPPCGLRAAHPQRLPAWAWPAPLSPPMVPARLRLSCCARDSALAACSARSRGRRGPRARTAGQRDSPQRPLLTSPHSGLDPSCARRPQAPPRRRSRQGKRRPRGCGEMLGLGGQTSPPETDQSSEHPAGGRYRQGHPGAQGPRPHGRRAAASLTTL